MTIEVACGDAVDVLRAQPAGKFRCCVTSVPYFGQRAYLPEGHPDAPREIGREPVRRCVLAGSAPGDLVCDPFAGSGTVGVVAAEEGRGALLVDLDARATPPTRRPPRARP